MHILSTLFSLFLLTLSPGDSAAVLQLRHFSAKMIKEWNIPGMSVSVVKDGQIFFNEGFGVKRKGGSDSVDVNTLFHLGSVSKSFTATVMASVVDDGLVSWDDHVKDILPDFEWGDPAVEGKILVRDLFTHATGLCPLVGTYIANLGYDRNDIYRMFRYIKPIYPFRSKFGYNNITFIIAAKVIEKVTGMSWEDNVRQRVFNPLKMTNSRIGGEEYEASGSRAASAHSHYYHKKKDGNDGTSVTPLDGEDRALWWVSVIGPAGSICSTSSDMAKYISCHLEDGRILSLPENPEENDIACGNNDASPANYFPGLPDNWASGSEPQLFSEEQMEFLHTGSTFVSGDSTFSKKYGYSWYVQEGKFKEIYHTGTTWGFTSLCGFVPELNMGYAILCNAEVTQRARFALSKEIIDICFALRDSTDVTAVKDYSAEALRGWYSLKKNGGGGSGRKVPMIIKKSKVNPELSVLVGEYTKESPFGTAEVTLENGNLYLTIGPKRWKHKLRHTSGNQFLMDSQGHTFPVYFHGYETAGGQVDFEIDFNYNENFGPWKKMN